MMTARTAQRDGTSGYPEDGLVQHGVRKEVMGKGRAQRVAIVGKSPEQI
jgi:hypothetical protein